jgi:CheY-like chemotaxis protein
MDLEMPVMDGVEATRRILAALPRTRIIIVSASAYAGQAKVAREAGAAAYVSKSRVAQQLLATVHEVTARSAAARNAARLSEGSIDDVAPDASDAGHGVSSRSDARVAS